MIEDGNVSRNGAGNSFRLLIFKKACYNGTIYNVLESG